MDNGKPIFVMALPGCRGRAIGDNAIRRAEAIAGRYQPVIISDSFPDQIPKQIRAIRVRFASFNWLRRFGHVPRELGFAQAVRRALVDLPSGQKIALLLCHGYTLAWFAGRWFRRRTDVPFGMFMHGHIFERPKGMYDRRLTAFYRALAPTCYREADLLFALSPDQAELAVRAGAARERVKVTPNGLDPADVGLDGEAVERNLANFRFHRPIRLLFVGRLNMEKGVDVLVRACAMLQAEGLDFRLRILGTGLEEANLRSLSANLGLEHVVEFSGAKPRKALGQHYLEHDVLLVPSISEPLGNVVLEGMSGGCVVVASNTGGIPSMVEAEKTGLLIMPGDAAGIATAVAQLAQDPRSAARMAQAGFQLVRDRFSWGVIGRSIVASVDELHS